MFARKVTLLGLLSLAFGLIAISTASANDWLLAPSFYSHDPQTGQRAVQYSQPQPAFVYENPTYLKSGYHHRRSSIRGVDGSLDQLHIVEEWGRPVRPYGEWERPFRPYSVPYQLWGPPYGGLGPIYQNFPGQFPYPTPLPGQGGPGQGGPWQGGPGHGGGYNGGPGGGYGDQSI
ncbi:hypothetical protein C5Y96_21760 [Blastopirellula marina]|uniref:Uncharacterized protein n=1 Tax=Blastopirellula marina TaxID=124 RepID=A0A2S8F1R0_9BACT|nr:MULTISPECIES: hypothetical protein [Pirellulaceae]PQO26079.1 hypothetical protein C5Y96_21760 [Blastopirellula marina]RCS44437.1 hypothetical protein DTL36_21805 [Bremerella cremea]